LPEINAFVHEIQEEDNCYTQFIKVPLELQEPELLESTQFMFVNDLTKFEEMLEDLGKENYIAVDVEHHDSYS